MTVDAQELRGAPGERARMHVNIIIDGRHHQVPLQAMAGAALKSLGGVPPDYQLFLEVPGPAPDRGIRDDEVVALKSGMRFYGVVSGTLG